MTFTACILKPRGPFHIGEREGMREGSEVFIHSDTLFSALCHSLLLLYGRAELERFLEAQQGPDPPLVLSSAFPRWQGRYYFPVPRHYFPKGEKAKQVKRLRFIEQPAFEKLLAGPLDEDKLIPYGLPASAVVLEDVPRVTVSRTGGTATEEGGFYHVGLVYYTKDADLFFLVDFRSAEWEPKVKAAIRLMCDEGIGGYRTVGKGQFEPPDLDQTVSLNLPAQAGGSLLLSLYYPADRERTGLGDGWYDLAPRKGYVYSPDTRSLRRKSVMLFAEGSVFPGTDRKGMLVDVTPGNADQLGLGHRVFRNGLAFTVPCVIPARDGGAHA